MIRIDPGTGIRMALDAQRADRPGASEIDLDMEFAQEGGEGATPYEVLLSAALAGDSSHFTRQDGVEECWRVVAPLLERSAEGDRLPAGIVGPARGRPAGQGVRRLAQPLAAGELSRPRAECSGRGRERASRR